MIYPTYSTVIHAIKTTFIGTLLIATILITTAGLSSSAFADNPYKLSSDDTPFPRVRDLNWLNNNFLAQQRLIINDLTRRHFGRQINGNQGDIALLQRIIDEELIEPNDKKSLQALGVVLGDVYVAERQDLSWRVYEDEQGPSHAVCFKDTKHCIFPVTMLSRRIEIGVQPDVLRVFKRGLDLIKPELPKLPYSVNE